MMNIELTRNRKRREFQSALKSIYETPDGKVFFRTFLDHCGVTSPRFSTDPMEINWNESRRHLAMSYLKLLAQDDMESILRRFEDNMQEKEEDHE